MLFSSLCRLGRKSGSVVLITLVSFMPAPGLVEIGPKTLPALVINPHSFELLANSRYSVHSGFEGALPEQVLSNVLWAMSRVPYSGDYREIYVATAENVYRYDPDLRTLTVHLAGDHRYNSGSAFEVGVATKRHEDAGMSIQAGLLAAIAFWNDTGQVVCCPMKWAADYANRNWRPGHQIMMVNVFGNAPARGLDTTLAAISSDSSLPPPVINGTDTFELTLMDLRQDSIFATSGLSLETVSQLLWAGYGVTPHLSATGRQGLTVPSAASGYFLTGKIYLVREEGVERYHNRLPPGNNLTTRDHRLERLLSGDRRSDLRQACARIPGTAPVYIVICVDDTTSYRTMQEVGFVAFNLIIQARALGLSGFLTMPLSPNERREIQNALLLPAGTYPVVVFSVGEIATGVKEPAQKEGLVQIVRAPPAVRKGNLRVQYLLRQPGLVRAEVFDLLGRPVKTILEENQTSGYHSIVWDGTDEHGQLVHRGSYLITISSGQYRAQHKVTWAR
ncbi:MAG: FlgD immunoglobulin-like domain containing protein [bacterium]